MKMVEFGVCFQVKNLKLIPRTWMVLSEMRASSTAVWIEVIEAID